MTAIKRFEDMDAWKAARELAKSIHCVTGKQDLFRDYALNGQIRRAAISVVSNIAEGFESQSKPVFCRYLAAARGSAAEVRAQLHLARDFGYLTDNEYKALV